MRVKPLKVCAGRHSFRPGGPEFEIADAEAKALIADRAVEPVEMTGRKRGSQKEAGDGTETTDSPAKSTRRND